MAAARFDEPQLFWNALWDRIEFRSKVPDTGFAGDMRISYAKFLQVGGAWGGYAFTAEHIEPMNRQGRCRWFCG